MVWSAESAAIEHGASIIDPVKVTLPEPWFTTAALAIKEAPIAPMIIAILSLLIFII
ncbi:hypothetical protein D3C87_1748030 [compost metagenome]